MLHCFQGGLTMTKKERIEALERRVEELERAATPIYYPPRNPYWPNPYWPRLGPWDVREYPHAEATTTQL